MEDQLQRQIALWLGLFKMTSDYDLYTVLRKEAECRPYGQATFFLLPVPNSVADFSP